MVRVLAHAPEFHLFFPVTYGLPIGADQTAGGAPQKRGEWGKELLCDAPGPVLSTATREPGGLNTTEHEAGRPTYSP
jgi:hypothetical protein